MAKNACNAGDLGLIPGLERSSGEGNGNPFQHSSLPLLSYSASLVAQMVKNLPEVQETPVQFLAWKDLLEKG